MGEPYLKEWLNINLRLSKEVKNIAEDFSNGYLFGEILHKHKLIPNFDAYKNTSQKKDISKNYQYLSKAFDDLNIKFSDSRRNDIINKKPGISSQYLFKLKQVLDQRLLCKETLKVKSGPNELHNLFKQMIFPNDSEKYYRDMLNNRAAREKKKLNPIQHFLSKEGQYYIDIGKQINIDQEYLRDKHKSTLDNIHNMEKNRENLCIENDNNNLKNWNHQMEIKRQFDKDQLKKMWKETEFYKTATLGSFKRSNVSNINEIKNFNNTLSRLGLDVTDGSNIDIKRNYMSPQIILKMYKAKIAEQEKSRKDKEKRLRKLHREEDKMIESNKSKTGKRFSIEVRDKNKTMYNTKMKRKSKSKTLLSINKKRFSDNLSVEEGQIDDYEKYQNKKLNYEKTLEMHKPEELIPKIERTELLEEEKIELPYRSMYDFFDKKRFFMGVDRLTPGIIKRKIEQKKNKDEKCLPGIKDIMEHILEITEESDIYLNNHKCELIEIPQWDKWMELLKDNISLKEYVSDEMDKSLPEKKSVHNLYDNENEPEMVMYKENEFFDYLNYMGNWDFNIKEKILSCKVNNSTENQNNQKINSIFAKNKKIQIKSDENPLELSLYKILGQDIAYILNAGKCQINGIKESVLMKMNNKEFEPGTQDINNITLPTKYNKSGHVGEIIEFYINMKYDKKTEEKKNNDLKETLPQLDNNNNPIVSKLLTHEIIKEEEKHEIDPSEEPSIVMKQDQNIEPVNFNKSGGTQPLLQSQDEFLEEKILEELKEKYTFEHIPIKLCFIGTSFSGRKTQSNILHDKYPNIKIYNVEKMIRECIEIYNKITIPIEEQPRYKNLKKNQIEQVKLEIENLKKDYAYQMSIIEPLMKSIGPGKDEKTINLDLKNNPELPDEKIIDLLIFYIRKDFPMREKTEIGMEIKQRKEKILKVEKDLENIAIEEQNKKSKINIKDKERFLKEKEQLISEPYIGFIINDFPKTLAQFKLFEFKCTGFVEELDKQKSEKEIETEELLYPLEKIYHPNHKMDDIKSVFNKYCIFNVDENEILNRSNGRMIDETTGIIYHNIYNPPEEKDKKLMERLKPITEPTEEYLKNEVKNYFLDIIDIKDFIELFRNIYDVVDLKDKNEENQNLIDEVLVNIIDEYENKFLNCLNVNTNNVKHQVPSNEASSTKIKQLPKNTNQQDKQENISLNQEVLNTNPKDNEEDKNVNTNENVNNQNNNSNINNNSIKNNSKNIMGRENSVGNISNKTSFILPIFITPLSKFNKRYNEAKKILSLSNLDVHFLNKWNTFLSEYKASILRNIVNISNIKQQIEEETVRVEDEYIQFLNLPSNKKDIIDRFTNKLSAFRTQFKDIKGHHLVIEEFHKDLTDLTNGIWNIINKKKQVAIEKRKQIMNEGFFDRQIKHFYENIENLFVQETNKFLLSVNIIKEFYYGLQSEILKSVILPFTSQIEEINVNSIFKDTENLSLLVNNNGHLSFPKIEKMFYNCMKIIFYFDYAIRTVDNKLKGNIEDMKMINNSSNNSGTVSIISRSRLAKKKKKKAKAGDSISEESKEIFNFIDETNTAIEIEKSNYKYRLLSIKFYSINVLTSINSISTELFELLDNWIIDSVHYQNHMMNRLLERLSKIVNNSNMKIMWDFELDKYNMMKIKHFEFPDPYKAMLEDESENENKDIKYSKYMPIIISLYNDITNFTLQNEFISKNVLIEILLKKNISSIELKNTPLYKLNYHMYQKLINKMIIKNRDNVRKDLINIKHIFTIMLLLPLPIITDSQVSQLKNQMEGKIISQCFLKESDFKDVKLWFENNKILKYDEDDETNISHIKNFIYLLYAKSNGNMNFEDFLNTITLKIFEDNDKEFKKDGLKLYKDLLF